MLVSEKVYVEEVN